MPQAGDEVWGALWAIAGEHARALDEQEGVFRDPPAYRRYQVTVATASTDSVTCRSYQVVSPDAQGFAPSPAYLDTILRGARACGLPARYIARPAAIEHNGYEGGVPGERGTRRTTAEAAGVNYATANGTAVTVTD